MISPRGPATPPRAQDPGATVPRHPDVAPNLKAIPGRVYSTLASRAAKAPEVFPLHVGDTWMEPATGTRMEDLAVTDWPGLHRYSLVTGRTDLVDAIIDWQVGRGMGPIERDEVLVAAGATAALGAVAGAIVAEGDEVLVLAPYWPLAGGVVRTFRGTPVAVNMLEVDGPEALIEALTAKLTPRTVALYHNTPHNPTGRILPESWIAAMAEFARRHDLWIWADEVYEHHCWGGQHVRSRPIAPERTLSHHSFSKAYGMAGNRCGYVIAPKGVLAEVLKVSLNTYYAAPTSAQVAALQALRGPGDAWAADAARAYEAVGTEAARRLKVAPPGGSTFLFVDVAKWLDDRGLPGFLEDLADDGVLVAPGTSFGPFPTHLRLCYTAAPPDRTLRGVDRLAARMSS